MIMLIDKAPTPTSPPGTRTFLRVISGEFAHNAASATIREGRTTRPMTCTKRMNYYGLSYVKRSTSDNVTASAGKIRETTPGGSRNTSNAACSSPKRTVGIAGSVMSCSFDFSLCLRVLSVDELVKTRVSCERPWDVQQPSLSLFLCRRGD